VTTALLPPAVDEPTWRRQLDELRAREKAATGNSTLSPLSDGGCQ